MTHFDTAVIGRGLIGSAAARYLSQDGRTVALIGPGEPADPAAHRGVYASHYDEGRLTRQIGQDPVWAALAVRAIGRYAEIEKGAGISFYTPVGLLVVNSPAGFQADSHDFEATAARYGVPLQIYPAGQTGWRDSFPTLAFPSGFQLVYEPPPAGMINPRRLVAAQQAIAAQQGAVVLDHLVTGVRPARDRVIITTAAGERLTAGQVLIAAGGFTNFHGLLPRPIPLRLKTETIILGEVSPAAAAELANLPTVIYQIDDPDIDDIYMTPPVRYPDGRYYFKMGCNTAADGWPETLEEVQAWFRNGDSDACLPAMVGALRGMLPGVEFLSYHSRRCIVCYTPSGYPTIDQVEENLFVATGGNGSGAKGSDTLGCLAALMLQGEDWPADFPRAGFALTSPGS